MGAWPSPPEPRKVTVASSFEHLRVFIQTRKVRIGSRPSSPAPIRRADQAFYDDRAFSGVGLAVITFVPPT